MVTHLERENRQDEGVPGMVGNRVAGPQKHLAQEPRQEQAAATGARAAAGPRLSAFRRSASACAQPTGQN